MSSRENYYELFGLDSNATDEQIRAAYKQLAAEHHPDRSHTPESAAKFKAASDAYHVLKDESRRFQYDRILERAQRRAARPQTYEESLRAARAKRRDTRHPAAQTDTRPTDPLEKARREKAMRELERFLASMGGSRKTDIDWRDSLPPFLSRIGALILTAYFVMDWRYRWNVFGEISTGSKIHDQLLLIVFLCLLGAGLILVFQPVRVARRDLSEEKAARLRDAEAFYWQSGWMILLASPFLVNLVRMFVV